MYIYVYVCMNVCGYIEVAIYTSRYVSQHGGGKN